MGSLLVWVFYYLPWLEENSAKCKASNYVILSSVERDKSPNYMKQLEDTQDFTCKSEY